MVVRVLAWALVIVGIRRHPEVHGGALLVVRTWAGVVIPASACALVVVGRSSPSMGWLACARLACDVACHTLLSWLVVVASGCRWWWVVAATGNGGDVAGLGCFRRWWWFMVVVAACGHLCSWGVGVCHCRWLLWAVVVRRVGGRCRSSCVLVVVVQ